MNSSEIAQLQQMLIEFRDQRNWQQFHKLKDLIISLNLEASELLELTQWKTDEQIEAAANNAEFKQNLADECADVFSYLLLICDRSGIDLVTATKEKIQKNALRYPVEQSFNSAQKYTEFKE